MLTDPDNFDVFGPNGIDCLTSERIAYDGSAANPVSAPADSINVTRALLFWVEDLGTDIGSQWQTHNPARGARVGLASGQPLFISAFQSVLPPGAGTSFYRQLCSFPGADYKLQVSFVATANTDNQLVAYVRYVDNSNYIAIKYDPAIPNFTLQQVIAGVPTILDTVAHDLTTAGVNGLGMAINLSGTQITFPITGGIFTSGPYTTAHLTGGPFAFLVDANAANVSGFGGQIFFQMLAQH